MFIERRDGLGCSSETRRDAMFKNMTLLCKVDVAFDERYVFDFR
jgi:hypothetical protein